MNIPPHITDLIDKYLAGTATPEDISQLNEWYHSFDDSKVEIAGDGNETEAVLAGRIRKRLLKTIRREEMKKSRRTWMLSAAAVLLIVWSGVAYFTNSTERAPRLQAQGPKPQPPAPIVPGGNKAILILADNSVVVLDSASNGVLSFQGSMRVEKKANGLLAYTINGRQVTENDHAFYNTISTPRGGQYRLILSDGTKVWLNAASSIRFPVVFTGNERRVDITGEAYFEVAKNQAKPFKVKAASSEIEVLGTHFNINAYDDEAAVKTTLLEGKVKVSVDSQLHSSRFLLPGNQASISKEGKIRVIENADTEEAVAWKNGRFQFKSADLKTILRQVSRWYDVNIEYYGNKALHFTGQLPRDAEVAALLEKLKLTGEVDFKIEGRKIIVLQ